MPACDHARQLGGRQGFVCLDCGVDLPSGAVAPLTVDQQAMVQEVLDLAQAQGVLTADDAAHLWRVWEAATTPTREG